MSTKRLGRGLDAAKSDGAAEPNDIYNLYYGKTKINQVQDYLPTGD
ncbi:MAG: hypothetical protein IPH59_05650 [bacterium]|nr:hypothetical protein [bacterium]